MYVKIEIDINMIAKYISLCQFETCRYLLQNMYYDKSNNFAKTDSSIITRDDFY